MRSKLPDRSDFVHWTPVTIRFSDQDSVGHVNNVAFCAYFEAGRIDFTSELLENGRVGSALPMVIASIKIDYIAQMHYPGNVEIGSSISSVGNSSFTVTCGAFKNDRLYACADAILVSIDKTGTPVPLTDSTVSILRGVMQKQANGS